MCLLASLKAQPPDRHAGWGADCRDNLNKLPVCEPPMLDWLSDDAKATKAGRHVAKCGNIDTFLRHVGAVGTVGLDALWF